MPRLRDHVDWGHIFLMALMFAFSLPGLATFAMLNRLGRATFAAGFPPEWIDYMVATPWLLLVFGVCFGAGHHAGLSQGRAQNSK